MYCVDITDTYHNIHELSMCESGGGVVTGIVYLQERWCW